LEILSKMIKNNFGEIVLDEHDLCDLVMRGHDLSTVTNAVVDRTVNTEKFAGILEHPLESLATWTFPNNSNMSIPEWDSLNQQTWYMPEEYKNIDIAEYILGLCKTSEEMQRCGEELLLYQERNLFDLLKYLKYLVDVMRNNNLIWGVGRGSSVSSYVLYLLGVHKIDSLYYDLDPQEFLR
jgi:DNA polymerase III alpha subunit